MRRSIVGNRDNKTCYCGKIRHHGPLEPASLIGFSAPQSRKTAPRERSSRYESENLQNMKFLTHNETSFGKLTGVRVHQRCARNSAAVKGPAPKI
jgi:hypothetical protein